MKIWQNALAIWVKDRIIYFHIFMAINDKTVIKNVFGEILDGNFVFAWKKLIKECFWMEYSTMEDKTFGTSSRTLSEFNQIN